MKSVFRVGEWQVEPHLNQLQRDQDIVQLRPQVMDLLVYLARRSGEVVTVDEMLDQVWGEVIVSPGSVYNCLAELRKAFNDDSHQAAYIETISKRGYRLVAPVNWPEGDKHAGIGSSPVQRAPVDWVRRAWPWALLLVAVLVLLPVIRKPEVTDPGPAPSPDDVVRSVAVLPFEDYSAEVQVGWSHSMAAALITELSRFESLRVTSLNAVQALPARKRSITDIAAQLQVDAVLNGSITREGHQLQLNARLLRARDESTIWTGVVQSEVRSVLDLQQRIAAKVASEVGATVSPRNSQTVRRDTMVDPQAYDAMVEGEHLAREGRYSDALEWLRRAVEIDRDFALGWAKLGETYLKYAIDDPTWVEAARSAAKRALELDPGLVMARTTLAGIALYRDWDWPTALSELEASLVLNPGYHEAHQLLGDYYEFEGNWELAIAKGIRATRVSPDNPSMLLNLGITYIFARRYAEAEQVCREALELRSDSSFAHRCIAEARAGQGDLESGMDYLERAVSLDPEDQPLLAQQAIFFMASGQQDKARQVLGQLDRQEREGAYVSPLIRGMVYMALGEHDTALDWIERAIDEKAPWTPGIRAWPYFDPLRGNPRFSSLVDKIGFAE